MESHTRVQSTLAYLDNEYTLMALAVNLHLVRHPSLRRNQGNCIGAYFFQDSVV